MMTEDDFFSVPDKEQSVAPPTGSNGAASQSTPSRVEAQSQPQQTPTESSKAFSLEEANEEIAQLLTSGKVSQREVSSLQGMMRDHAALKEKVNKLKSLLGRSAKAQREAKMELESTAKKLEQSLKEIERLNSKLEKLANRPTHMDLLADFETNFDKALLSVGHTQTGGETSAAPSAATIAPTQDQVVDGMLLQELAESQHRTERLENLNTALLHRSSQLEQQAKVLQHERNHAIAQVDRLSLELRMAQMEAENASRSMQDKLQSLQEMQLEIDLVTKASMDANVRAVKIEEAAKSVQTDREMVKQLQAQVLALQEWALASAEAKRLSQERARCLEERLRAIELKDAASASAGGTISGERSLTAKISSLVIGAGDVGFAVIELGEHAHQLKSGERVLLRWKFDVTPVEHSVEFNLLKGKCDDAQKRFRADYLIKDRTVTGGAAGEIEGAFAVQNSCTLLWSNEKSWVRPRSIKYNVEILAVKD